jgi:hypothetical protein
VYDDTILRFSSRHCHEPMDYEGDHAKLSSHRAVCGSVARHVLLKATIGRNSFRPGVLTLTSRFPCSFPEEISARKIFGCITVPTARIYPRARVHLTSPSALRTLLLVGRMRRRSLKYLLHLLTRGSAATSRSPFPMQPLRRVLRCRLYHGNSDRRALISTLYLDQVLTRFSRGV